ncbi:hypothetical protein [Streptomyces sp. NPDC005303]|uniref:hypothetical protein n=1 Tax=Streptomyces sp. NPDC005303 TaxID=3155713 RepID=UPI0033B43771
MINRQPDPRDRSARAVLTEAADHLDARAAEFTAAARKDPLAFVKGGTDARYRTADCWNAAGAELRRLAAEATPEPATHACGNCDGINPDICLSNPDRPIPETRQSPDPAPRQWCKCRSCWGWFVEDHPGEDLDELGKDLGWWSGLPEHRDAPAAVQAQPGETQETVHGCPPDGSGLTPCCGRTPFELPLTDRISSEEPVTCKGADRD